MAAMYRVTAAVVVVTAITAHGPALTYVYRNAFLPAEAKPEQISHLLRRRMIEHVNGARVPVATQQVPVVGDANETVGGGDQDPIPGDDPERAAAQAKLPEGGALPHHAAGQPVWVEWHVAHGGNYEDLKGQDKPVLVELAKSRQS